MVASILVPGFELKAALRRQPRLALRPAALAPCPGEEPLVGAVTTAAAAAGVSPGMRLGEALATCPQLVLVERDPAGVEEAWEGILRRLEEHGFAVEPVEPGCLYFETRGVERLYGGVRESLRRALEAVGPAWEARAGAASRRFAALAAASVARPGQALVVSDDRARDFLAPLPLTLLPLEQRRRDELDQLGVQSVGDLAGLPGAAVAERLGADGRRAWSLARGEERASVRPRRPAPELVERLEFPEAVGNELTLRRALAVLVDRALARPERRGRQLRKVALSARLVGGGSWRRTLTLREPSAEARTLRAALGPKLTELGAPVTVLVIELVQLADGTGRQLELCEELRPGVQRRPVQPAAAGRPGRAGRRAEGRPAEGRSAEARLAEGPGRLPGTGPTGETALPAGTALPVETTLPAGAGMASRAEWPAPSGTERRKRLAEGLRQVRASVGAGAVAGIVEVAPWSRIPEQRALLVPRDA